ncbi:MAG: pirin family protein [Bacteroidetes bacterium]|nr:MAG: pirin family protein [Bacteroidota bacterium]
MKSVVFPENERGKANHGWLKAAHSFSFASWYDPDKIHFGALRVLNDDWVAPGMGFSAHPHDNMEIITIPLEGSLRHKDSMGHTSVIKSGEVQVMSAGTGIVHSELNPDHGKALRLFQIWIFPDKKNVEPRYDQITYNTEELKKDFVQVVSPDQNDKGTWIHQQAWIHLTEMQDDSKRTYAFKKKENGLYIMVINGNFEVDGHLLKERDAIGIWDTDSIDILNIQEGRLLLIEVPLQFNY